AGGLALDDDAKETIPAFGHDSGPAVRVPAAYFRLAGWSLERPRTGHGHDAATRYVRMFQSRRSLLTWKIHGRRTDGWTNDDFPTETVPGDANTLAWKGKPIPNTHENQNRADLDFTGTAMPPPEAVKSGKVKALTDEDRRTIVRWIDLGCPIDLDYDAAKPQAAGYGWMCDDNRPTLTLTYPRAGANELLTRILVGMH